MLARAITAAIDGVSPGVLFQNSEPGVWFDPSDLKTLYQDAAGTTLVTGVEQPVGLMLDKSKGLVLGPELVTNGGFDTDTAWSKSSEWSISSGVAIKAAGSTSNLYQTNILAINKSYRVSITVVSISGTLKVLCGSGDTGFSITSAGTYIFIGHFLAGVANLYIQAVGACACSVDNISVRELPGYHATQSTAGSRPTLSARYNMLTGTDGAGMVTQTYTTTAQDYVLQFSGTGSVALSTTATGTYTAGTNIFTASAGTLTLTVTGTVTNAILAPVTTAYPSGLTYGSELVTNGDFSNGTTGWSTVNASSSVSVVSGEATTTVNPSVSAGGVEQQLSLVVGKSYSVSYQVKRLSGDYAHCAILNNAKSALIASGSQVTSGAIAPYSFLFVATETNSRLYARSFSAALSGSSGGFDNISVREVTNLNSIAITYPTGALATVATQTATTLAANYTLSFSGAGTITLSGTASGTYSAGTSIFTATAGTLTLTVNGQVTNAQLVATEKSHPQGLTYGSELVTNGGFDSDTGWTKEAGWTIGSGVATSSGGNYWLTNTGISLSSTSYYLATFTVSTITAGNVKLNGSAYRTTTGTYSAVITGQASIRLYSLGFSGTIDNISVKEITNATDNRFPYQSVTSATVYDSDKTKFPWYLRCTDHWMQTPSIDASAFDKVAVFAAIRKTSDSALAVAVEFSATSDTTNGSFVLFAPSASGANSYRAAVKANTYKFVGTGAFSPAPSSAVATIKISTTADITLAVNGVERGSDTGIGSAVFGNYPLYIGKRAGTSLPFNGFIYQLAVRFAASLPNDNVIAAISKSFAAKAGIKIV